MYSINFPHIYIYAYRSFVFKIKTGCHITSATLCNKLLHRPQFKTTQTYDVRLLEGGSEMGFSELRGKGSARPLSETHRRESNSLLCKFWGPLHSLALQPFLHLPDPGSRDLLDSFLHFRSIGPTWRDTRRQLTISLNFSFHNSTSWIRRKWGMFGWGVIYL